VTLLLPCALPGLLPGLLAGWLAGLLAGLEGSTTMPINPARLRLPLPATG
jgi:hypothetical protein